MATIQTKSTSSARIRTDPDINSSINILGTIPASTTIHNAVLSEDSMWYEISTVYIHASTVNVLVPDETDPTSPTHPSKLQLDPLKVPYRSQWDVDANNRTADCGQTCVAMLAQWKGFPVKINDLRFQSQPSGLSSCQDLVNNFNSIGIRSEFRLLDPTTSINNTMLPEQLLADLPAICLVSYAGFDRLSVQDKKYTGWHWLVLLGIDNMTHQVITNDPDFWPTRREEGHKKRYTFDEWNKAFIPYSNGKLQYVYIPNLQL
jgi:hypothetical protein